MHSKSRSISRFRSIKRKRSSWPSPSKCCRSFDPCSRGHLQHVPKGKIMSSKHLTAAIAAAAALLSAPCYAAAERDPCSLLTPAQVGTVLGTQVGEGKRLASLLCEWTDSTPGSRKKVDLTLISERGFEAAKTPVGGGLITKTPANGVGDDAVFAVTGKVA